jgi:hypothetical protein
MLMMTRRVALVLLLLAPIALVAGTWLWVKSAESRRWAQLERRVAELARETEERRRPRRVLRGPAVPGDAWTDYTPAIGLVQNLPRYSTVQMLAHSTDDRGLPELRALVAPYLPAVDRMRQGTRRAEARRVRLHTKIAAGGIDVDGSWLQGTLALAYVSTCRARWLAADGKPGEAAELLMDLTMYAQDVADDGSDFSVDLGGTISEIALQGLRSLLTRGRLSSEECLLIDRDLAQLDTMAPRFGPVLLTRLHYFGTWILNGAKLEMLHGVGCIPVNLTIKPGWRDAFSLSLMQASGFDQTDAWTSRLLAADEGSLADEEARWKKAFEDRDEAKNVYFRLFTQSDGMPNFRLLREQRARLRLVRLAVHYRATGEFLELPGFGHTVEAKAVTFWGTGVETFTLPSGSTDR